MEKNSPALTTALLILDVQPATMGMLGESAPAFAANVKKALAAARRHGILVLHVVVGFRKGFPELSAAMTNATFAALRGNAAAMPGLENPVPDPSIEPQPNEMVITKRRVSAFAGSDLEVILRGYKIEHLVLTGIATSAVVLSTLCQAADMDYRISVLSDVCADRDPEIHTILLSKVFPRRAEVLTADQWITGLAG
jgi:nicotinamidase-related amidase